jgi:hypothetical protein
VRLQPLGHPSTPRGQRSLTKRSVAGNAAPLYPTAIAELRRAANSFAGTAAYP